MQRALIAAAIFELLARPLLAQSFSSGHSIRLNADAIKHAKDLIAAGHVVNDKRGSWRRDQPARTEQNELIDRHSIEEYARWHLAVDESHPRDSKARYKFPIGDFKDVHRCALLAVIARARQYRYAEIEKAARELLELVEASRPR